MKLSFILISTLALIGNISGAPQIALPQTQQLIADDLRTLLSPLLSQLNGQIITLDLLVVSGPAELSSQISPLVPQLSKLRTDLTLLPNYIDNLDEFNQAANRAMVDTGNVNTSITGILDNVTNLFKKDPTTGESPIGAMVNNYSTQVKETMSKIRAVLVNFISF
ncbi:uncharacterized protein LOC110854592 [Folsomia candida]|uniref:Uncharacterized protein n=1 Tax=Folsomia candida TaxID=158441 RepID=A0A226DWF6_FOLCA|nr:uncharacterized protein LOC110854592 [Folsomia candida]OXA49583.1 hypothetical protein Fcan01_15666 [Folsomia candida]